MELGNGGKLIWIWCMLALCGRPKGAVKATVWTDEVRQKTAVDTVLVSKIARHQQSAVFAPIEWTVAESATLRAALLCYTDNVSVSLSMNNVASIELKLARALHEAGLTLEDVESWLI